MRRLLLLLLSSATFALAGAAPAAAATTPVTPPGTFYTVNAPGVQKYDPAAKSRLSMLRPNLCTPRAQRGDFN
jgi:hypothetical protein